MLVAVLVGVLWEVFLSDPPGGGGWVLASAGGYMAQIADFAPSRSFKLDSKGWGFFSSGSSILPRKWPAKMTKTRQNENENFQNMAVRDDS